MRNGTSGNGGGNPKETPLKNTTQKERKDKKGDGGEKTKKPV